MIFRYTILYVKNVSASLDFYERAFGFSRLFLHEAGDYGELSTGDTKLAFSSIELMQQLGKNPAPPIAASPTFELAFESDNVQSDLERAVNAGAELVQELREEPWGQSTSYVSDPDGYLIEICSVVQLPNPG